MDVKEVFSQLLRYFPAEQEASLCENIAGFSEACLSAGDFTTAGEYADLLLSQDTYGTWRIVAYRVKLFAKLQCHTDEEFRHCEQFNKEMSEYIELIAACSADEGKLVACVKLANDNTETVALDKQKRAALEERERQCLKQEAEKKEKEAAEQERKREEIIFKIRCYMILALLSVGLLVLLLAQFAPLSQFFPTPWFVNLIIIVIISAFVLISSASSHRISDYLLQPVADIILLIFCGLYAVIIIINAVILNEAVADEGLFIFLRFIFEPLVISAISGAIYFYEEYRPAAVIAGLSLFLLIIISPTLGDNL